MSDSTSDIVINADSSTPIDAHALSVRNKGLESQISSLYTHIRALEEKSGLNTHKCINCAIKHLSSAYVICTEMLNGYNNDEHAIALIGNLNEAQEQLTGYDSYMSGQIRKLRIAIAPEALQCTVDLVKIEELKSIIKVTNWRNTHGVYSGEPDEEAKKLAEKVAEILQTREIDSRTGKPVSPRSRSCGCRKSNPDPQTVGYSEDLVDIVIPIGSGSVDNNNELRYALRAIDANGLSVGNIYVVTTEDMPWLRNVNVVNVADTEEHNKDANLISKVAAVCDLPGVTSKIIFWSDDQVLLQKFNMHALSPVYNNRKPESLPDGTWGNRVRATLNLISERTGREMLYNWESHCPAPYDVAQFAEMARTIDYKTLPGYTINTLYYGLHKEFPRVEQTAVKVTVQGAFTQDLRELTKDRLFIGYNNAGYRGGVSEFLAELFPTPCKYEA